MSKNISQNELTRGKAGDVPKTRKHHEKTEYEKFREQFRRASPRHVVTFEADMSEDEKRRIFHTADELRQLGNKVRSVLDKRVQQMIRTKKYRRTKAEYGQWKEKLDTLKSRAECDPDEYAACAAQCKRLADSLNAMQKEYKVTKEDARLEMQGLSADSGVNSVFCLNEAMNVWNGFEKILYGNGRRVHYKKRGDLPCLRARQINRAIILKSVQIPAAGGSGTTEVLGFKIGGIDRIVTMKDHADDRFLCDEEAAVLANMADSERIEQQAVTWYEDDGIISSTYRPCFCSLKPICIRGRLRVYVQITVEGNACPKYNSAGELRSKRNARGTVGIDIGTQSVCAVGNGKILFDNLAERNHHSTRESEERESELLRRMDESRRATNPKMFDEKGQPVKLKDLPPECKDKLGLHRIWRETPNYRRLKTAYHEISRRNADSRKYANRELVNKILEMGDEFVTEPPNASRLMKKAKKSEKVIQADGTVKNTKRKRFGKSIENRCPGQFQSDLKTKAGSGYHEVKASFRASQYDHTSDTYEKKKLNTRKYHLKDGTEMLRDPYSAFLMSCADIDFSAPDRSKCEGKFQQFKSALDRCVEDMAGRGYHVCNSGI